MNPDRAPCPCGSPRADKAIVCPACWAAAERVLRLRCTSGGLDQRRVAVRELLRFAATRREATTQPQLAIA